MAIKKSTYNLVVNDRCVIEAFPGVLLKFTVYEIENYVI